MQASPGAWTFRSRCAPGRSPSTTTPSRRGSTASPTRATTGRVRRAARTSGGSGARPFPAARWTIPSSRPRRCPTLRVSRVGSGPSSCPAGATPASSRGGGPGASTRGPSGVPLTSSTRRSPSRRASARLRAVWRDAYGLTVTTSSRDALATYDRAVEALLGWDARALDLFRQAHAHDPGLALAHAGEAVCLFLDERFADAQETAKTARAAAAPQSERERRHVEALARLVEGKTRDAEAAMRAHLGDHPRDLVVFQRLYFIWFWQGRFPEMLDLSTALARHHPGNSFMLGLHAFALEQAGRCDEAGAPAPAASLRDPLDP